MEEKQEEKTMDVKKDLFKCECGNDIFSHLGTFLRCSSCKKEYTFKELTQPLEEETVNPFPDNMEYW